ncbi:hypothetical protein BKA61DRAFT_654058 [Leptodontidium sp. MPI-SDFR-AT-0119]|nr:hypothetical protein BKA61DRAFT_654058 [Leptodontidium sp. MPI-SDFR-AT-0119]
MTPPSKRVRSQAFAAPKDRRAKKILPGELRNHIWGYVLGFQLVHVMEERIHQNHNSPDLRLYHTVCESPVTEKQAYDLSRNESYETVIKGPMSEILTKCDMRQCHNRHAVCYEALRHGPTRRLHIDLLSVCRQTYMEAIRLLWGTNTWSIDDFQSFRIFFGRRNALQRSLMKKVHLGSDIVIAFPPRSLVLKFGMLEELYIDVTINCREELWCRPFFRSRRISVICSGTGDNTADNQFTLSDIVKDDNGTTTAKERIEKAEMWCARLFEWGEATSRLRLKNDKKRAMRSASGVKQIDNCRSSGSSELEANY